MLNNLTNFFNLIRGKRIKKELEPGDLIAVGTQTTKRVGEYKPTAIQYKDLLDQFLSNINVDTSVNYANVLFVDLMNGNNLTAAINDFTKPYFSPATAVSNAVNTSPSSGNRALVYIRRGSYSNFTINLQNYVDIYCEPGVIFNNGYLRVSGTGTEINCNFLGYAKINITGTSGWCILKNNFFGNLNIEFDTVVSRNATFELDTTNTNNQINIKGNSWFSEGFGSGNGFICNNATNVNMFISKSITGLHSVITLSSYTGTLNIECPRLELIDGTLNYGGNFKQAIIIYNSTVTKGSLNFKGNIYTTAAAHQGGITAAVRFWVSPNLNFTINGNIYAGDLPAVILTNGTSNFFMEGSIISNRNLLYFAGTTTAHVKNMTLVKLTDTSAGPITILNSSVLYMDNSTIYSAFTNGNIINIESNTGQLYINNVVAEGVGTNYSINIGATTPTIGLLGLTSNKDVHPSLVNIYTVGNLFNLEPLVKAPNYIL
jgi:hypothetical protein